MKKAILSIIFGALLLNNAFTTDYESQALPDYATEIITDDLYTHMYSIDVELSYELSQLSNIFKNPVTIDYIMWSTSEKLDAFKKNPTVIACACSMDGINFIFLNEAFRQKLESNKDLYDNVIAHEILHLYVPADNGAHNELWHFLADYINKTTRFNITETYSFD